MASRWTHPSPLSCCPTNFTQHLTACSQRNTSLWHASLYSSTTTFLLWRKKCVNWLSKLFLFSRANMENGVKIKLFWRPKLTITRVLFFLVSDFLVQTKRHIAMTNVQNRYLPPINFMWVTSKSTVFCHPKMILLSFSVVLECMYRESSSWQFLTIMTRVLSFSTFTKSTLIPITL